MSVISERVLPVDGRRADGGHLGAPSPAAEVGLMEHLGALAARTGSEAEAEAFLGALPAVAARLAPAVTSWVPDLARSAVEVGRQLWKDPTTRSYVQAVPDVVRRTAADVAGRYARGAPVSPDLVGRRFAHHAARALRDPDRRRFVIQRARAADRAWTADARRRFQ